MGWKKILKEIRKSVGQLCINIATGHKLDNVMEENSISNGIQVAKINTLAGINLNMQ
jgi:uncharacterized protein (DUF849 family)